MIDTLGDPTVLGFAMLNGMIALSVYLTFACGLFCFAQVGFVGIGAYTSGVAATKLGLPGAVSVLLGVAVGVVVAVVVVAPMLRLRRIYLAMVTFGFSEIVVVVASNGTSLTGGDAGLPIPKTVGNGTLALFLIAVCLLVWRWRTSLLGEATDGVRQDELVAGSLGIDPRRYTFATFVVSAAIASCAGGLWAQHTYFISPRDFGFALVLNVFLYVVVGGMFRWYGSVLGAFVLTYVLQSLTSLHAWRSVVSGALMTAVVILRPEGLASIPVLSAAGRLLRKPDGTARRLTLRSTSREK